MSTAEIATTHTSLPFARAYAAAAESLRATAAEIAAAGCADSRWTASVADVLADVTETAERARLDVETIAEEGDACLPDLPEYAPTMIREIARLTAAVREMATLAARAIPADMGNLD